MDSRIAKELKLRYEPVVVMFADEKPEGALEFTEGRWACVMAMFNAAAKGKVAVFSRETCGCGGGQIGLGFRDDYDHIPGGFEYFLSTGRGEGYPEGEAYKKTPELVKTFAEALPMTICPTKYVVFKSLDQVDLDNETPEVVCLYANPDQLSALVVLANYGRPGLDNVMIPFGAGCHSIFLMPYAEGKKEMPKAVVGVTDITTRPMVDPDLLTFSVPWSMFREMEDNIPGSFIEKESWAKVKERL